MLPHGWNINNGYILMKSDFAGYYWQMFFSFIFTGKICNA
jgi:hypothetical protein